MRNTTMFVILLLVLTLPFTKLNAQTQITSCDAQFMDNGNFSNYINNDNSEWLICPDDNTQILSLTFTHVEIEAANNSGVDDTGCYDVLYIYDGNDDSAPLIGSFCGEESGSGKSSFVSGHTLNVGDSFRPKNSDGCFFIRFNSDQSKNLSGWIADVSCCTPSLTNGFTDGVDVPLQNNYGNQFDLIVDNSCNRNGNLSMFAEFESTGEACFTKGLSFENQAFYAFTSNSSGGFIEFEIDSLESVGVLEMVVWGPVQLNVDSTMYTGGYINDCVTGEDPFSLFFNAGPNQTYILGVASERAGMSSVETLPSTVGLNTVLPVKLIDYRLSTKDDVAQLSWTTSQEVNNDRYEIFRSFDGVNFDKIGTRSGGNNTDSENSYSFYDSPNAKGDIYYFLKQIDLDGKYTDFSILRATFSKDSEEISSFPNPSVGGNFSLKIGQNILDPNAQIQIFDQMGKQVINRKLTGQTTFGFEDLTPGLYIIKIVSGSKVISHQHIIY